MSTVHRVFCVGLLAALGACGSSGGGGGVLVGPIVIDFENRPDDGFVAFSAPVVIAAGVTITNSNPVGALMDFTTADGWVLGVTCFAEAISGTFMMGNNDSGAGGSMTITFASRVSRVEVFADGIEGVLVELEAFGAGGAPLGLLDSQVSECPSLRGDDLLTVDAGSNLIVSIEIRGASVAIDDLAYWYFS